MAIEITAKKVEKMNVLQNVEEFWNDPNGSAVDYEIAIENYSKAILIFDNRENAEKQIQVFYGNGPLGKVVGSFTKERMGLTVQANSTCIMSLESGIYKFFGQPPAAGPVKSFLRIKTNCKFAVVEAL